MGMMQEFKEFALKGNVVDLAVGVVIGAAFGKIVTSLVDDIIMPLIGTLFKANYADLFVVLSAPAGVDPKVLTTLDAAKKAGAATLNYGNFITIVLNFLIVAFSIFLVIKNMNRLMKAAETAKK